MTKNLKMDFLLLTLVILIFVIFVDIEVLRYIYFLVKMLVMFFGTTAILLKTVYDFVTR